MCPTAQIGCYKGVKIGNQLFKGHAMNAQNSHVTQYQCVAPRVAQAITSFSRSYRGLLASMGCAALLLVSAPALAATAPSLGTASTYGIAASTFTNIGNTAPLTRITGDVCTTTPSATAASTITGAYTDTNTPPGGSCTAAHATMGADITAALATLNGQACTVLGSGVLNAVNVGSGLGIFPPGCYTFAGAMSVGAGTVTLNGSGVYIFKTTGGAGSTLTMAAGTSVAVAGGACESDVFWAPNGATTLGANTAFVGSILDGVANAISIGSTATVVGRLLSFGGTVQTDVNDITVPTCAAYAAPTPVPLVPPTLGKAFSPSTINADGVSTLTITLSNPNVTTTARMTAALTDTLPSGVVIAATPNVGTTCGGGEVPVAVAGSSTVTLPTGSSIMFIPANDSCTVTVDVTSAIGGSYINTLPIGALVTNLGNNAAPAIATLTVISPVIPPTLGKAFSTVSINAGGISTLTVTLSNPDAAVATLTAALTDNLPSGVVIAATPNVGTTCTGAGAPVAVAGGLTVTLPAGRSIPANGSCTLTVDVTAAVGGSYINTLLADALKTSNGNNAAPAIATLTVVSPGTPPTLGKAFSPFTINAGGVSTLTISLINPNPAAATLTAALIDTLPSGVVIAPTPSASTTCGGVPVAVAGSSTVTLPSGTIPANGSCTLTVNVTAAAGGSYINTLLAGALRTSNGNNPAPVVASLTVVSLVPPPTLGKAFSPATINAGGVSTLTVTLSNPSSTAATLSAALTDTLPSGVVIAPTPSASTTCGGGAPVAVAGSSTVTLPAGRSIPASGSCTVSVNVTAAAGGSYINTLPAGALVTSNGNNAAPAIATLTVVPPVIPPTSAAGIPTLSEWAMIMLAALLSITGFVAMRRQAR